METNECSEVKPEIRYLAADGELYAVRAIPYKPSWRDRLLSFPARVKRRIALRRCKGGTLTFRMLGRAESDGGER